MSTPSVIGARGVAATILLLLVMASLGDADDSLRADHGFGIDAPPAPEIIEETPAIRYVLRLCEETLPAHALLYMIDLAEHDPEAYAQTAPAAIVGLSHTNEFRICLQIADKAIEIGQSDGADTALQAVVDAVVAGLWERGEFPRLLAWGEAHAFFIGPEQKGLDTSYLLLSAALGKSERGRPTQALLLLDRAEAVGGRVRHEDIAQLRRTISRSSSQRSGSLLHADQLLLSFRTTRGQCYAFGLIALLTALYHVWRHVWTLRRKCRTITQTVRSGNAIPVAPPPWNPFRAILEAIPLPLSASLIILFELIIAGHWLITRTSGLGDPAIWYGVVIGALAITFEIWLLFQLEGVYGYVKSNATNLVQLPSDKLDTWLDWHKSIAFDRLTMTATFVSALFAALLTVQVMTDGFTRPMFWWFSPAGKLYGCLCWAGAAALGGLYFAPLLETTFMLARLGRLPVRIRLLDRSQRGVKLIGNAALRVAFCAGILGSIYAALAFAPPQGRILGGATYAWLIADLLLVGFVFFYPQMAVHDLLVNQKQKYLDILQSVTEHQLCLLSPSDCDSHMIDRAATLATLTDSIDRLSTWPFDARSIATVASTMLIPVLVAIVELVTY